MMMIVIINVKNKEEEEDEKKWKEIIPIWYSKIYGKFTFISGYRTAAEF